MRNAMKEGHEYLSAYSPNGGFIAFTWSDQHGKATTRPVTLSDVKKFMSRKTLASSFTEKGYRIVKLSCHPQPVLVAPVKRISDELIQVSDRTYEYRVDKQHDGEVLDGGLVLHTLGGEHEIKHVSTRAQVLVFLNHEAELTEQAEGL